MMGLPAGWVTGVPGLTRSEQLKMLGNGVVPQQAAAAVASLLPVVDGATAASPSVPPARLLPTPTATFHSPQTPEQVRARRRRLGHRDDTGLLLGTVVVHALHDDTGGDDVSAPFEGPCDGCEDGALTRVRRFTGEWGTAVVCAWHEQHVGA